MTVGHCMRDHGTETKNNCDRVTHILGDPGATSRDEAILISGESLLQALKSPWELILSEPVSNANQRGGPAG